MKQSAKKRQLGTVHVNADNVMTLRSSVMAREAHQRNAPNAQLVGASAFHQEIATTSVGAKIAECCVL